MWDMGCSRGTRGPWIDRRAAGYSLTEILVVIALIALIALATIPAFGSFLRSYRLRAAADEMMGAIRGARQMAITMRQDLTVTFTPAPANTYSYYHPIRKQTTTVKLPPQITMVTDPSASFAPVFKMNGSVTNSSSPSASSPTSRYVELQSVISSGRTDRYRFGFSAAGQVVYTVSR